VLAVAQQHAIRKFEVTKSNIISLMRKLMRSFTAGFGCLFVAMTLGAAHRDPRILSPQSATSNLTQAERALVASSRNAIIATGISQSYFDRHFTLVKVVNQPGDRRIVWKFSLNDYTTTVTDVLGYYTKGSQRIDTHSATTTLGKTSEILATISRRKADQIMQRCIGPFTHPSVEYRATGSMGARLVFTAEAVPKSGSQRNENREREKARDEARKAKTKTAQGDIAEGEQEGGAPIIIGSVDLETGRCTKGQLDVAP
jgi:hypothetical protein